MFRPGLTLSHPDLANGRWAEMTFAKQMGNIGSEVSRAIKSKARNNYDRMSSAATRAIELFELSIDCNIGNPARLKELCRAKEEFCDYIYGDNQFSTEPVRLQRYYDQFVTLIK